MEYSLLLLSFVSYTFIIFFAMNRKKRNRLEDRILDSVGDTAGILVLVGPGFILGFGNLFSKIKS